MWHILKEIAGTIAALFAFSIGFWKTLGRKWYAHYKGNRNLWRVALMDIQKMQNDKLDKVVMQLYPNGGTSVFDKLDKILDNQIILQEKQDASLYLDNVPTVKSDMNGMCTFVNLAYLRLCGFNDASEAMGEGALRSVHPDDAVRIRKQYISAIKTNTQFVATYKKINVTTGEIFTVTVMTKIIKNSKGVPVEVIGVLRVHDKLNHSKLS